MRPTSWLAASFLIAAALPACSTTMSADPAPAAVEFVIVRHAEKLATGGDDPALSDAGRTRAAALATAFADHPVAAVYSTAYARTRGTAAPIAAAHGLAVSTYDAREPADAFAARLRAAHASGTVVVVGHSNTVPGIAAALCRCDVEPMEETEYDRLLVVTAGGAARLDVRRQPLPAP